MEQNHSENTKRIAKNTLMLYGRMLFSMVVSLYTSRVLLNTLGVVDYGIQNVVGGVVGMFSLISGSLSASISRFLTFELGKDNSERLVKVFSTSLVVQLILAVIIVILIESIGVWFLNNKMIIPKDRLYAANWLLQFATLSFVVSLISVPYNASIVSHEHMSVFAYIGIADVISRLFVVLALPYLPFDKLITYSIMHLWVGITFQFIYWRYCRRHFRECRFHFQLEKSLFKEMLGFAGWNFIGVSSAVLRDQGGNVILNLFWGPALNSARGIAQQVNNAVGGFVNNFMTALNPQITKSYASGDRQYMMKLVFHSARFSFYLLFIVSLPVLFNTSYLINIWLGQIPAHVVLYVRLILIFSLCDTVSNPLITVMLATGNIRNYQIVVGGLQMMNLPISYLLLKLGFFPEVIVVVSIFLSICCLVVRLIMLRHMINFPLLKYTREVLCNLLKVIVVALIGPLLFSMGYNDTFLYFGSSCVICFFSAVICIFLLGCNKEERLFIIEKAARIVSRVRSQWLG